MFFGLLLVLLGLFLMLWGFHYFGVLVAVGGDNGDAETTSNSGQSLGDGTISA